MNSWESIFLQSPVNDGYYDEDRLPQIKWDWPSGTWFQARLDHLRERHPVMGANAGKNFSRRDELPTA